MSFCFDKDRITIMTKKWEIKSMVLKSISKLVMEGSHVGISLHGCTKDLDLDFKTFVEVLISQRNVKVGIISEGYVSSMKSR